MTWVIGPSSARLGSLGLLTLWLAAGCGGTVSPAQADALVAGDGAVAADGGVVGGDALVSGGDSSQLPPCDSPVVSPDELADETLELAARAIRNAYYGCDPTASCSSANAGPDTTLRDRLGRPTVGGHDRYWCPGKLSHEGCRSFAEDPQVAEVAGPGVVGGKIFAAPFVHGVLYGYLDGSSWRVADVADASGGRSFFTLHEQLADPDHAGVAGPLGVPYASALGDSQRFVAGCCIYTASFDEAADAFALAAEGDGCPELATVNNGAALARPVAMTVNGNDLTDPEEKSLRYIAGRVIGPLANHYGTRADALERGSTVAWWSLKEGVLGTPNPIAFSLCDRPRVMLTDDLLGVCKEEAWQVGIAAIQAPRPPGSPSNYFNKPIAEYIAAYEATAATCLPSLDVAGVLRRTAREAGYAAGSEDERKIVESTEFVRAAWLLRASAVGVARQYDRVYNECVDGSKSWCSGTTWTETKKYAPTAAAAAEARADIRSILSKLR